MDYTSDSLAEGFFMVQTKIRAAANSKVRIVQIQRVGSNVLFLNDFSGK